MHTTRPGSPFVSPLRRFAEDVSIAMLVAAVAAGCATRGAGTDAEQKVHAAANAKSLGQVAELRAIGGSAVTGKVRVVDRGNGAMLSVAAFNVPTGAYRVTINRNANCTSPNGFSAGPAWAPRDAKRSPDTLIDTLTSNSSGAANATVHVRGLSATGPDGVAGHSVILYAGARVTAAQPGVPNERIACGVFEPTQTLEF